MELIQFDLQVLRCVDPEEALGIGEKGSGAPFGACKLVANCKLQMPFEARVPGPS